jgi:hypothetical protein
MPNVPGQLDLLREVMTDRGPHYVPAPAPRQQRKRRPNRWDQVLEVLRDHQWHTCGEIGRIIGAPATSVSARIRELKRLAFGSHPIIPRPGPPGQGNEYQLRERA